MALNARWIPRLSLHDAIRVAIGVAIVVACIAHEVAVMEGVPSPLRFLEQLDLFAYDARLRLFMPRVRDTRIVIVDIDDKSLIAEGHWPWPRNKLGLLVKQLMERHKVKVIGFDMAFPEADTSSGLPVLEALAKRELANDAPFITFLETARAALDYDQVFANEVKNRPVVLGFAPAERTESGVLPKPAFAVQDVPGNIMKAVQIDGYNGNYPRLQEAAEGWGGHFIPVLDIDGATRRIAVFQRYKDHYYQALALGIASTYLNHPPRTLTFGKPFHAFGTPDGKLESWLEKMRIGDLEIPMGLYMTAMVPYRERGGFRYVSATDVMRGMLVPSELNEKIVLVGTSAPGLVDMRATPIGENLPGVEVHANLVSGILDNTIKYAPPDLALGYVGVVLLLLGLPIALLLHRLSALWGTVLSVCALVAVTAVNLYLWQKENWVLPIASPVIAILSIYLLNMIYGFFAETRSRRLITGLFGTYVPKELVDEMSKNPGVYSMKGESREMTVLFSDVRDFTSISEGLTPEDLKDLMNTYLTAMTEKVQEKRGTIDKYIGDAIMAFWGAPLTDAEHATHALETAIAMQKGLRDLDAPFAKRGWPPLHIGVGLNCGMMSVGDMGSKFRRSYTVMGDAVNLASRLESLTKEYGVGILVTENIVRSAPGFLYREIDLVRVKGKHEGVSIFEPLGRTSELGQESTREVDRFHKVIDLYRKQRWDEAEALLKNLAYADPDSKVYKIYLGRIAHFRANPPPANWDGVFVYTTK